MSYKQKICTVFSKECWIWWWTAHFNSCHNAQYIECASNFFLRTCIQVISNYAALYSLIYTKHASNLFTCNLHFFKSSSLLCLKTHITSFRVLFMIWKEQQTLPHKLEINFFGHCLCTCMPTPRAKPLNGDKWPHTGYINVLFMQTVACVCQQ